MTTTSNSGSKVKEYLSDSYSAAIFSLKLGNDLFGLDAIITGNSKTRNGEAGVVTAFVVGEPFDHELDWGTVHRNDLGLRQ